MYLEEFINSNKNYNQKCLKSVLTFIYNFREKCGEQSIKAFMNGYCYYFANILKIAFNRGEVMLIPEQEHFVWVDSNQCSYDINGVNTGIKTTLIPIDKLGISILDYLHIPNCYSGMDDSDITNLTMNKS